MYKSGLVVHHSEQHNMLQNEYYVVPLFRLFLGSVFTLNYFGIQDTYNLILIASELAYVY
jgi:hypothetical protein